MKETLKLITGIISLVIIVLLYLCALVVPVMIVMALFKYLFM